MSKGYSSQLDNRLNLCAEFVRDGVKIADIGTDHAYLPVWLCRIGKCPSAIAADINPDPLKRGKQTIIEANMSELVKTRLSDGLKEIGQNEADDIVIAGMGGELIARILSDWEFSKDSSKHFILQPMTKAEVLIKWLCDNGYEIIKQDCCIAAKKCYTVLLVKYTGEILARDESFYYLAKLTPNKKETHLQFVRSQINRLLKQANGDVRFAALANKLEESINDNNK